jgi:hypothetical protein
MTEIVPILSALPKRAEVIAVPFLDGHIPCVDVDGEPMVILRPVSDLLGLRWAPQYTKLSADQTACVTFTVTQVPGDDQARKHMVISLETFVLWLGGLQPSRVRQEARDTVLAYKREAGRALRNYFFGGAVAVKPRDDLDILQGVLDRLREDRDRIAALESQQTTVQAKVAAIEGRYDWFTALGYAKLHDYPTDRTYLQKVGTKAGRILRAHGEEPIKRQDATFGAINTYPADVLEQAFAAVTR